MLDVDDHMIFYFATGTAGKIAIMTTHNPYLRKTVVLLLHALLGHSGAKASRQSRLDTR